MKDAKILTLHPEGKKGVNIALSKYEQIKEVILSVLQKEQGITLDQLFERVDEALAETFDGKIGWYVMSVKLDLEARNIIERIPKSSPQKLRLVSTVE